MTVHRLENNFLEPIFSRVLRKIPVSSATRTQKTLWEIASAFSMDSLSVNWWATFPVTPHKGVLISNYALPWDELSAGRIAEVKSVPNMVYPDEIWPDVVSYMEEVVEDGVSGILVKSHDEKALAEAIMRLIGDTALREHLGREARARVEERFDSSRNIGAYVKLFGGGTT